MVLVLTQIFLFLFPWRPRRRILELLFAYHIDPMAKIGYSVVLTKHLVMKPCSRIGHLNFIRNLASLSMGEYGRIGNLNWITAFPKGGGNHFLEEVNRDPSLTIGAHSALTHRHLIDCTDRVSIGEFTTVAGWNTQILTHAIDLVRSRQGCAPVTIGNYCFVGSRALILKGARLPDRSVLGAGSVLTRPMGVAEKVYVGNPAVPVRSITREGKYFSRDEGFVV
jgi:acetyltransferase-like isoleucine patch superfamily enzyme